MADALEEVDFFLQQNLLEESRDELERLKESHPDHPEVLDRLAKLEHLQTGEAPAAQVSSGELEEEFDLAAEIESEVGEEGAPIPLDEDFQYSFDDVFSEFKKGVEKVVAKEDSSTHFDLGIAYKEMGLVDDAISEFTIAAQDPGKKRCPKRVRENYRDAAPAKLGHPAQTDHRTQRRPRRDHYQVVDRPEPAE